MGLEVRTMAEARLRRSGYSALRDVNCVFHDGMLTLRGRVPTHYLKQVAQQRVRELEGVRWVNNQIEVSSSLRQDVSVVLPSGLGA